MPDNPILDYRFQGGTAQNADGSRRSDVRNCTMENINVALPGWQRLRSALRFAGPGSVVQIDPQPELSESPVFSLELAICPESGAARMNLVEGQSLPVSFYLAKRSNSYRLFGAVQTERGWIGIDSGSTTIALNRWHAVAMVFSGDAILLLHQGSVVTRRLLQPEETIIPAGDGGLFLGTWVDGRRNQFEGSIGALRAWSAIPPDLVQTCRQADHAGVGAIESKYLDLGGPRSFLRDPTGAERTIVGGRMRNYQGGSIYWSPETGAHEVRGAILQKYRGLRGPAGSLGFPLADEANSRSANARKSRFQNGAIYWSGATGAHALTGLMFARYVDLEEDAATGSGGLLGLPISDERQTNPGRRIQFQNGNLYWSSAAGAFEVHGAILAKYEQLQGPSGIQGLPLSDEEDVLGRGGTSIGKMSRFEGGTIYWSPRTGALEVHGEIRGLLESGQGLITSLGFPITDEVHNSGGQIRYNDFERGIIFWTPGRGAQAVTSLTLFLGKVSTSEIDDGMSSPFTRDKSAEVYTKITVLANGRTLLRNQRSPRSGHSGTTHDINRTLVITPVHAQTTIQLDIKVWDHDALSADDYLGGRSAIFNISNTFGLQGAAGHLYGDMPATDKGGDAPSLNSIRFTYSISIQAVGDRPAHFRNRSFWRSDNFPTSTLSRQQYADCFRDVEIATNTFDRIINPFDTAYYELAFRSVAATGNCFGISLEALYASKGLSPFVEPLHNWRLARDDVVDTTPETVLAGPKKIINDKHGFQLGASAIDWIISRVASTEVIRPTRVYDRVKIEMARGNNPVLCMNDLDAGKGHCVLPYRHQDGDGSRANPHKIFVADPNVVWRERPDDPSTIEIFNDETFRFVSNGVEEYASNRIVSGILPGTLLVEIPFSRLCTRPRTPFWEVLMALSALVGLFVVVAGDAQAEQITVDGHNSMRRRNGRRRMIPLGTSGLARIPLFETQTPMPYLFARRGKSPDRIELTVEFRGGGNYQQLFSTARTTCHLVSAGRSGVRDTITLAGLSGASPSLEATTSTGNRTLKVNMMRQLDVDGKYRRGWQLNVALASGDRSLVSVSQEGRTLLVRQPGPVRPLRVNLKSSVDGRIRQRSVTVRPEAPEETLEFSPLIGQTLIRG